MKVRSFRAPRLVVAGVAQGRAVLRGFWYLTWMGRWGVLAVVMVAAVFGLLLFPHDETILAQLHSWTAPEEAVARRVAWFFGTWGDYLTYNVPLALGLWFYGVWTKSSSWRRIAVICFLGATLAGLLDDCLRLTLGRPRPDAHLPDGFYGLPAALRGGFQSFPSGHAASVFGAAMALIVTDLPLGLVTTVYAFAVLWARLELYRHYPSDVMVGSILGICVGLLVGFGAQARRPRTPVSPF